VSDDDGEARDGSGDDRPSKRCVMLVA
jgi:hypothetical protein